MGSKIRENTEVVRNVDGSDPHESSKHTRFVFRHSPDDARCFVNHWTKVGMLIHPLGTNVTMPELSWITDNNFGPLRCMKLPTRSHDFMIRVGISVPKQGNTEYNINYYFRRKHPSAHLDLVHMLSVCLFVCVCVSQIPVCSAGALFVRIHSFVRLFFNLSRQNNCLSALLPQDRILKCRPFWNLPVVFRPHRASMGIPSCFAYVFERRRWTGTQRMFEKSRCS